MGFFDYLDANPAWALVYLVVICLAVMGAVESIAKRIGKDSTPTPKCVKNDPKVLTEGQ